MVPIKKEARTGKVKIIEQLQKLDLADYNLLKKEDLWQAYYRILLIIMLKKFIKLNVNT